MTRSSKHWSRKIKRRDKKRAERLAAALEAANVGVGDHGPTALFSSASDVFLPTAEVGKRVGVFNQGGKRIKVYDKTGNAVAFLEAGQLRHFVFNGVAWLQYWLSRASRAASR